MNRDTARWLVSRTAWRCMDSAAGSRFKIKSYLHRAVLVGLMLALSLSAPTIAFAQAPGSGNGPLPAAGARKPQKQTLHYKARPGLPLTLITPSDPAFDNEMAAIFPRYLGLVKYPAMRPYLAILRNDSPRTARACEVIWRVQAANPDAPDGVGEGTVGRQGALTTPLELRWPGGLGQSDKSIRPGEARLLSPFFNGGPADASVFGFFNQPALLPDPASFSLIHPELDCVVYGDGSFAGPNRTHLLLRYFVARDAQHDEALTILRGLRATPKDPRLKAGLERRMQIGARNKFPNTRVVPMYVHARAVAAQEFEEILQHDGYDQLQQVAQELVAFMPPHERFTSLGGHYHKTKFRMNGVLVPP